MSYTLSGSRRVTRSCWGALAGPGGLDSSLLDASREDLISPKGNLVAISKLCLAKLRMRNETGVYHLPGETTGCEAGKPKKGQLAAD